MGIPTKDVANEIATLGDPVDDVVGQDDGATRNQMEPLEELEMLEVLLLFVVEEDDIKRLVLFLAKTITNDVAGVTDVNSRFNPGLPKILDGLLGSDLVKLAGNEFGCGTTAQKTKAGKTKGRAELEDPPRLLGERGEGQEMMGVIPDGISLAFLGVGSALAGEGQVAYQFVNGHGFLLVF